MKKREDERNFKDPVCGMEVSRMTAASEFTYKDKTYYFCADVYLKAFEAGPEKYIHHHRQ